jgi:hypothetical protein
MGLQSYRTEVTKQSIAADFWALSKFVCRLDTINSCTFDSVCLDPPTSTKKAFRRWRQLFKAYWSRDAPAGLTSKNCTLCPRCIYVFCIYLRTNSDLCHLHHKLIGFYNRDEKCLLRGTNWVFKTGAVCTTSLNGQIKIPLNFKYFLHLCQSDYLFQ